MSRAVLRVALAGALGLALVAWVLALALAPPRAAVPERGEWIFRDVTLVEPGRAPRPGSTLRVSEGVIRAVGAVAATPAAGVPSLAGEASATTDAPDRGGSRPCTVA